MDPDPDPYPDPYWSPTSNSGSGSGKNEYGSTTLVSTNEKPHKNIGDYENQTGAPGLRIRIRAEVKTEELQMHKMEAVDTHNGGVEAQNGVLEGLKTTGRRLASR